MTNEPATPVCVNPVCDCASCACERPCTCGLTPLRRSTHEMWDPAVGEYRFHEVLTFVPASPSEVGVPTDDGHQQHGHQEHGLQEHGHQQHGHAGVLATTTDLEAAIAEISDPTAVAAKVMHEAERGAGHAHVHDSTSVRTAHHRGHEIRIVTTYELLIDGQPMTGHLAVRADGSVHYHGLPNYATSSAIDLAKQIIDSFPDDYARSERPPRLHAAPATIEDEELG